MYKLVTVYPVEHVFWNFVNALVLFYMIIWKLPPMKLILSKLVGCAWVIPSAPFNVQHCWLGLTSHLSTRSSRCWLCQPQFYDCTGSTPLCYPTTRMPHGGANPTRIRPLRQSVLWRKSYDLWARGLSCEIPVVEQSLVITWFCQAITSLRFRTISIPIRRHEEYVACI